MLTSPSDTLFNGLPTLDVRSPGEFAKGHAPGAISFPLFSDEERAAVGTVYKQQGRDKAIDLGMEYVEPKLADFLKNAEKIAPNRILNMYCWRGGMRSASLAEFLRSAGFTVHVIVGGYKAWRREVMDAFKHPYKFINLGGYTGVGKTDILLELDNAGEQIINLEGLASHTGSAFNPYEVAQPSTEQFENLLAEHLLGLDPSKAIWIEDESKAIGKIFLNHDIYQQKQKAPFVLVNRPKEERVTLLCELYGTVPPEVLKASFEKIGRRLGGQYVQAAHQYIDQGDLAAAARIALRYYDKAYLHAMEKQERKPVFTLSLKGQSAEEGATRLIQWKNRHQNLFD